MLPKEYVAFADAFARCREEARATHRAAHPDAAEGGAGKEGGVEEGDALNMWIMKPVGSSRGRGISILNDISGVSYGEAMVIQRYIAQPLLLDGFKFDLRLYVLVTSFNPLEAFLNTG